MSVMIRKNQKPLDPFRASTIYAALALADEMEGEGPKNVRMSAVEKYKTLHFK